ncbi:MAG: sensor histidine kinase [Lachnospiraceae bacterium]|nr:sensor histidine kinase [Lachnospiraceae bacterium]
MITASFRRELLVCFVIAALVPLMISSICLVSLFQNRVERSMEEDAANHLESISTTLEETMTGMDTLLDTLSQKDAIRVGITTDDSWEKNQAYTTLYGSTGNYRDYATFEVYDVNGHCLYTTRTAGNSGDLPVYWGILKEAGVHADNMVVARASRYVHGDVCLQAARGIVDEEDNLIGYLLVGMTGANIETLIAREDQTAGGFAIMDETWNKVYCSSYVGQTDMVEQLRSRVFSGSPLRQKGDTYFTYLQSVDGYPFYVAVGERDIFTGEFSRILIHVLGVLTLGAVLVCMAVSGVMSKYLAKPVYELVSVMQKVRQGQLEERVHSTRHDEFGMLSDTFDGMTEDLKEYMEIQVRQQKEINDVTIAAMQAQLNPHFLYNTLDTMKWVAKAKSVPELANMASDLANILRTSISGDRFIRLAEELQLVKSYMKIQQIRFENSFSYDVEVPMELEYFKIPKLIIQPVVENALIHGLKGREHGHIFVNIYDESEMLYIEVSDDGCGMPQEEMERINRGEVAKEREVGRRRHIGLDSIAKILKLYYGETAGVSVRPGEEGGTLVTLFFPRNKEG